MRDHVSERVDDLGVAGEIAVCGNAVDGGDVGLVLDGPRLEERFPMVRALGGPGGMDGEQLRAALHGFAVLFREPQVETDGGRGLKSADGGDGDVFPRSNNSLLGEERMHLVVTGDLALLVGRVDADVVRDVPAVAEHSSANDKATRVVCKFLQESLRARGYLRRIGAVARVEHFREQYEGTCDGAHTGDHVAHLGVILPFICMGFHLYEVNFKHALNLV